MPKCPYVELAVVHNEKICGYLLSGAHPSGRYKAAFFSALGFRTHEWRVFAEALINLAQKEEAFETQTEFGKKYRIEGNLLAPDGRAPLIRSIWIYDERQNELRLSTAYPLKQRIENEGA